MNGDSLAFVDTNILVYAYDESDPVRQSTAEGLLRQLMDEDRIRLSTQVLQELYVTMTRKVKNPWAPADVLVLLDHLAAWPLIVLDHALIREAILLSQEARLSFWDSLILIAAKQSGATTLYTEDLNHGQVVLGVKVLNPFAG